MTLKFEAFNPKKHNYKAFSCGVAAQDGFIHQFAKQHTKKGISKTHVLIDNHNSNDIIGYLTLSACHIEFQDLEEAHAKGFPHYPIPGVRLCQLAVSRNHRGNQYGDLLIAEAVNRARSVRDEVGISLLVVDVQDNDENLHMYYRSFGFSACKHSIGTLYLLLGKPGT